MSIKEWKKDIAFFLDYDIFKAFTTINKQRLKKIFLKNFNNSRFWEELAKLLNAGIFEDLKVFFLGTIPYSVISPFLFNIYMHELDLFIKKLSKKYNSIEFISPVKDIGIFGSFNNKVNSLKYIYYVRYAGNFLVGITGSRDFVNKVCFFINTFIKGNLHLDIKKSNIHYRSQGSLYFLGYLVTICMHHKRYKNNYKEAISRYKRRLLDRFKISDARLANSKVNSIKADLLQAIN
jgi:hypothetical protein